MLKKLLLAVALSLMMVTAITPNDSEAFNLRQRYYEHGLEEYIIYHFYSEFYGFRSGYVDSNTWPDEAEEMRIYIPYTDYNVYERGGIDSSVIFSGDNVEMVELLLEDLIPSQVAPYGWITIDLTPYKEDYNGFEIRVMQSWGSLPAPAQLYSFFNEESRLEFDVDNYIAVFFVDKEPYQIQPYDGFVTPPTDTPVPPSGYRFTHWKTNDGAMFNFDALYERDLALHAHFMPIVAFDRDTTDRDTQTAMANLLAYIGFYNTAGMVLIYAVSAVLLNIGLIALRLPTFPILVINFTLIIIYALFGLLPIWSIFILMTGLIIFMVQQFRGSTA